MKSRELSNAIDYFNILTFDAITSATESIMRNIRQSYTSKPLRAYWRCLWMHAEFKAPPHLSSQTAYQSTVAKTTMTSRYTFIRRRLPRVIARHHFVYHGSEVLHLGTSTGPEFIGVDNDSISRTGMAVRLFPLLHRLLLRRAHSSAERRGAYVTVNLFPCVADAYS